MNIWVVGPIIFVLSFAGAFIGTWIGNRTFNRAVAFKLGEPFTLQPGESKEFGITFTEDRHE
jgi:hypothetical protein